MAAVQWRWCGRAPTAAGKLEREEHDGGDLDLELRDERDEENVELDFDFEFSFESKFNFDFEFDFELDLESGRERELAEEVLEGIPREVEELEDEDDEVGLVVGFL